MNVINENQFLCTAEFALAGCLLASNFSLESLNKNEEKRVYFCFKKTVAAQRVVDEFWKGTFMVNAVNFHNSLKMLKARLRNEQ